MFDVSHARDETVNVALAFGGKFVSSAIAVLTGASSRDHKTRIANCADERYAFINCSSKAFVGVKGEAEIIFEIAFNYTDIAQKLCALLNWHDNKKVINVTAVMFVPQVKSNKTVKLIKKDIR